MLSISDLTVSVPRYGRSPLSILRGIDLDLTRGEIVALVGESGSGKTVLARSIMQLVPPPARIERGAITFEGHDLRGLDTEALRRLRGSEIAMIISNPRGDLDPLTPVGRQIGEVLRQHVKLDGKAVHRRVLELLDDVSIPDPERRLKAYPHELSGGMAQRVVIAIALACSPKLIISDDATSGLDVTVQAQVLELLQRLVNERGAAMLFITRDIGIAAHFSHRVAVIYAGELVELAPRADFFEVPSHPYSMLLLAAFSQNARLRRHWLKEGETRHAPGMEVGGCAFAARCVRAQARCLSEHPALREVGPGHYARCHFPVDH